MGNRGPACSICSHPRRVAIEAAFADGGTVVHVASLFSVSRVPLEKHRRLHVAQKRVAEAAPTMPALPDGAPPKEIAEAHMVWVKSRIARAEAQGAPDKDIAALAAQYTSAQRHYARLAGALDITEAQIVRSVPFQRVVRAIREALSIPGPMTGAQVWERVAAALSELSGNA